MATCRESADQTGGGVQLGTARPRKDPAGSRVAFVVSYFQGTGEPVGRGGRGRLSTCVPRAQQLCLPEGRVCPGPCRQGPLAGGAQALRKTTAARQPQPWLPVSSCPCAFEILFVVVPVFSGSLRTRPEEFLLRPAPALAGSP